MKKTTSLMQASFVLAGSSMVVKLLSAAYRIPLTRMMGAYAMGKYSTVFNIFMPFFALATAGITPTIARFTAQISSQESQSEVAKIKKTALSLYIAFSVLLTALFVLLAMIYSKSLGEKIILTGSIILAPNLIFASIENVFKGLSQGQMNMLPTAKANLLESISKTLFGLCSVFLIINCVKGYSTDLTVNAAFTSITASGLLCWVYLAVSYNKHNGINSRINAKKDIAFTEKHNTAPFTKSDKTQLHKNKFKTKLQNHTHENLSDNKKALPQTINALTLLQMSVPISMSALTVSIVNFFDTAICLPLLKKIPVTQLIASFNGASFKGAGEISMYLFGTYQGMVLTIFNMVPALISCIGTACLPIITKTKATSDTLALHRQANKLFRAASAAGVPMCIFIFFFREDILSLLFATNYSQTVVSKTLLGILIPSGILASFTYILNAIMHAFGKSDRVFKVLIFASIVKCTLSFYLCQIPTINIKGFAVTNCIFYAIIFIVGWFDIKKLGVKFNLITIFFIPILSGAVAIIITKVLQQNVLLYLPVFLRLLFCGVIFSLLYLLAIILTGFIADI